MDFNRPFFEALRDSMIDDITADPHKFGIPTFQEFAKNPDKYRLAKNHTLVSADQGSALLNKIKKQRWFIIDGAKRYEFKSSERLEKGMLDMGLTYDDLQFMPQSVDNGKELNGELHVIYVKKT